MKRGYESVERGGGEERRMETGRSERGIERGREGAGEEGTGLAVFGGGLLFDIKSREEL